LCTVRPYTAEFNLNAVKLSEIDRVRVQDVANVLETPLVRGWKALYFIRLSTP
jgi:hypothetical protein